MSSPSRSLRPEDRRFFKLVSRAAFSNPFSEERDVLDREIAEVTGNVPDVIDRALHRVSRRLGALESREKMRLAAFGDEDRRCLEHAILFDAFHRFVPELDRFIDEETARAGKARLGFAEDVFALLTRRGIDSARSARMLEVFYQMRRAHRFIGSTLIGRGRSMRRVREALWNNVFTRDVGRYERYLWNRMEDFSTLLVGETGTGKSAAAAAIGQSGFIPYDEKRRTFEVSFTSIFVPVNLSEFPEALVESELFGHKKGAFTGAVQDHHGWLARCTRHGAIFLDEIGELTVPVQVKLLRVLQERTYTPVGSHEPKRFGGRVIAATNQPLDKLREEGRFRSDLYFRLCSDVVHMPPLRAQLEEQPELLPELVAHIVARVVGEPSSELGDEVCEVIRGELGADHRWLGNVREREQCVRRVLLTQHCNVSRADSSDAAVEGSHPKFFRDLERGEMTADRLLAEYCAMLHRRLGSYAAVAAVTALDPRTAKRFVHQATGHHGGTGLSATRAVVRPGAS